MPIEDKLGKGSRALLLLAAVVVVLIGLNLAQAIVVPLLFAAFAAAATSPVADWLQRKHVPNGLAVLLVIFGSIGVIVGLGVLLTSALIDFNASVPEYLAAVTEGKRDAAAWLYEYDMRRAASTVTAFDVEEWSSELMTETLVSGAPDFVSALVITLLVIAFILLESATFRTKIRWSHRLGGLDLSHFGHTVKEVQKYLTIKTGISGVTGVGVGLWTAAWGVEHALLWGLLSFTLNFIPNVGSALAAIPPILVALAEGGPGTAAAVAAGIILINMVLGNVVEPKLLGRALGLSPLVVIVSMIVWGYVLGPVGAVLSAPLTMIIKIALMRTEDLRWVAVLLAPPRSDKWHERHSLDPPPPLITPLGGAHGNEAE